MLCKLLKLLPSFDATFIMSSDKNMFFPMKCLHSDKHVTVILLFKTKIYNVKNI